MPKILFVEDHAAVRDVLHEALVVEGHEVTSVGTVAAAQHKLRDQPYDILIADIGLPDGSGRALAAMARDRGTKAILISGHLDDAPAGEPGAIYMVKPFTLADLVAAIHRLGAPKT